MKHGVSQVASMVSAWCYLDNEFGRVLNMGCLETARPASPSSTPVSQRRVGGQDPPLSPLECLIWPCYLDKAPFGYNWTGRNEEERRGQVLVVRMSTFLLFSLCCLNCSTSSHLMVIDLHPKLFYFSFSQNDLCTRNKHQFIFSIDNLNNLATKMANKETLQKMI
jgi:hypothetical protein